jgi:hypothetical protein
VWNSSGEGLLIIESINPLMWGLQVTTAFPMSCAANS